MDCSSNIWRLHLSRFFHALIPAYVIERLFWEQRGMTVKDVIYCEIVYAITVVVLEIPTGIVADRWSRRGMLVVSSVLDCLEFLIIIYATRFWHFAMVTFLAGIGTSARSGSENALLYDSLAALDRRSEFEKHLGRMNASDMSAVVLAALSGGVLAGTYGYELNYWISVGSVLISTVVTFLLVEPASSAKAAAPLKITEYVTRSLSFLRRHPAVGRIVLTGMVLGASITYLDEFWQIYLNRLSVPTSYFGLFIVALFLGRLPGSMLSFRLLGRFTHRTLLAATVAVFSVGFACVSWPGIGGIAAMIAVSACYGLVDPLVSGYLHHRVDSEIRATVDSFQSLGLRGISIVVGLGFGHVSSCSSVFRGYGLIAALCWVYLCWFLLSGWGDVA